MLKKLIYLIVVFLLIFSVAGLTGCSRVSLEQYKETAKAEITAHIDGLTQANYTTENWALIGQRANEGKAAVDAASDKTSVDAAVVTTKAAINGVAKGGNMSITFPSVLENLSIEDFDEEFFEENTLILVPLNYGYLLYDHVEFYTVSVKNGKLNFVVEITDPVGGGDEGVDFRIFVICISNEVLNEYEIGEKITFNTYDFSTGNENNPPLSDREWLAEIRANAVEHRVALFSIDLLKPMDNNIISVLSRQALNELLS